MFENSIESSLRTKQSNNSTKDNLNNTINNNINNIKNPNSRRLLAKSLNICAIMNDNSNNLDSDNEKDDELENDFKISFQPLNSSNSTNNDTANLEKQKEIRTNIIQKVKAELEKENNWIDYFLVLGLEPSICGINELYESTNLLELIKTDKFKEIFTPKILSQFPPFEKTYVKFDNSLKYYCFIDGFDLKCFDITPKIKIFSFILDNCLYSLKYPRKYCTCLLFYESLVKYQKLQEKIKNIKITNNNKMFYVPKCLLLISVTPLFYLQEKILKGIYEYTTKNKLINIPIEKIIQNLVVEIPSPPKGLFIVDYNYVSYAKKNNISNFDQEPHRKGSLKGMAPSLNKNNNSLVNNDSNNKVSFSINLNDDLSQSQVTISNKDDSKVFFEKLKIINQKINELPNIEKEIELLLLIFSENPEAILEIYKHLLLESKILVFSKEVQLLMPFIYCLLNIIFPFKYTFQVITNVPSDMYHILESISPYIFGINKQYNDNFFNELSFELTCDCLLIIDLDENKIILKSQEKFPDLPKKLHGKLLKRIEKAIKKVKEKYGEKYKKYLGEFVYEFSDYYCNLDYNKNKNVMTMENDGSLIKMFYEFNLSLLQNYDNYLNNEYYTSREKGKGTSVKILFKCKEFINSESSSDKPFYDKFITETQIFSDFVFKRMIPKNVNDKIDILFFDEELMLLKNKNNLKKCIFINSHEYDFKGTYSVPKIQKINVKEMKNLFINGYDRKLLIENGQLVKKIKKSYFSDSSDYDIKFSYLLFPKLNEDLYLSNENDYILPPILNNDIELINNDLVSKSHLSTILLKNDKMENYIYLIWLELFSVTFHRYDLFEQKFRFFQMLLIINKVKNFDIGILDSIFKALSFIDNEDMIMILYKKLMNYKLNPSEYIYCIVDKIMMKKKIKNISDFSPDDDDLFFFSEMSNILMKVENIDMTSPNQINLNLNLNINLNINNNNSKAFNSISSLMGNETIIKKSIIGENEEATKGNISKIYQKFLSKFNIYSYIKLCYNDGTYNSFKNRTKIIEDSIKAHYQRMYHNFFKKRTLKNKFESNVISQKVKFDAYDNCIECNQNVNLFLLSKNYELMKQDTCWAKCPFCQEDILPKIKVILGREFNENNIFTTGNTSTFDNIILNSPYQLRQDLTGILAKYDDFKFDINNFRFNFSCAFWNCIWYFYINGLDYEIILPFEYDIYQNYNYSYKIKEVVNNSKVMFTHKINFNLCKKDEDNNKDNDNNINDINEDIVDRNCLKENIYFTNLKKCIVELSISSKVINFEIVNGIFTSFNVDCYNNANKNIIYKIETIKSELEVNNNLRISSTKACQEINSNKDKETNSNKKTSIENTNKKNDNNKSKNKINDNKDSNEQSNIKHSHANNTKQKVAMKNDVFNERVKTLNEKLGNRFLKFNNNVNNQ